MDEQREEETEDGEVEVANDDGSEGERAVACGEKEEAQKQGKGVASDARASRNICRLAMEEMEWSRPGDRAISGGHAAGFSSWLVLHRVLLTGSMLLLWPLLCMVSRVQKLPAI